MNQRIAKLRAESLKAVNRISPERAVLLTEFYQSRQARGLSVPVLRAKAFRYILENKKLYIGKGELIVGERGPEPKATPTYPEITLHSLKDLEILDSRPKVSFKVDEHTKTVYKEKIIPFWQGKTMRDKIFGALPPLWKQAYQAGVFTEFQEQRAPGHTVAGQKIFAKGMADIKADIRASREKLDFLADSQAFRKQQELEAMEVVADSLVMYARRHAQKLEQLSEKEPDSARKQELAQLAAVCRRVPEHAPRTFHEALQHYWFVHVGVITELNPWDSFNPGRLDQHLLPFFRNETRQGTLTTDRATELLQALWVKFNNHPAPPKIGVTAQESSTYTDFCLINVGGVKPDGSDASNELSYMILDVIEEMRLLQPGSMVQLSKKNPDRLIKRALKISKTGFGQPSIFNTDAIVQQLLQQGKGIADARNGGASGCIETGAFGTECYLLTGYFSFAKILEITLHNGKDPLSGKKVGIETGDATQFESFEQLLQAYQRQLEHFADIKIKGNNLIEWLYANQMPAPFLSLMIDDCVANGTDYNAGGARYNTSYVQGVGTGSTTDMLTALKFHVFEKKTLSMAQMLDAMENNFENHDKLRADLLYNTPKYGNDDEYADNITRRIFEIFYQAINGRPTVRGGVFRINLLPTTSHVYFGSKLGASPDGRKAGTPLSEGISPVQGADRKGPVAVLNSAAKIDHLRTGGTLLNQKFSPSFFKSEAAITRLAQLVRSYFRMDGHHIQFNVVSAQTLRKARKNPEQYSDLIVRVAGYSDYFNDLSAELQDEIIRRTEHENL